MISTNASAAPSKGGKAISLPFAPILHRYTLIAGLLIVFVGLVTFVAPTDPDVWWHLSNGRLILDSGIPSHDVYSFTAQGRPWLVQEWLTEVVMYSLKSLFGYGVLSLLFGMLQAAGALIVYLLLRSRGAGRILSLVLLMLYLVFATPTWGVRPQVLTPLFLGVFYFILQSYKSDPSHKRKLWLLPPLMALWANLHASYFMGVALIGAFLVGEFLNNYFYRAVSPAPLWPLLVTLAASLAATLLNPYFLTLWSYPLTYALNGTSNPLLRYTQEWQSPNFHEPVNLLLGLSLIMLALVGIARPVVASEREGWRIKLQRKVDITELIILGAFTLLALQAVRLVPLYGVMVLPLLAHGLSGIWPALSRDKDSLPSPVEGKMNWAVGAAAVALLVPLLLGSQRAQTESEPRTDTGYMYPVGAADYISKLPTTVRIYNEFSWGGYFIYRLYPAHLVFIDGRADMYREGIFDDFMTMQNVAPQWRETLAKYKVDLVAIIPGSPLAYALAHEPGWKVAYKDGVSVVYSKRQ
ncbi:MAG: hypothetical protein IVW55_05870 [Chloroflexi bacterium]|nr:hypothetical protein [Chloroflexota bacterium]